MIYLTTTRGIGEREREEGEYFFFNAVNTNFNFLILHPLKHIFFSES